MLQAIDNLDPIAVALEEIQDDGSTTFAGIDLDSGKRVRIVVDRHSPSPSPLAQQSLAADGLILILTIARL